MNGRADLNPAFRASVIAGAAPPRDADGDDETADAAAVCPAWLGSESRKALLADIGVGTIDQALLSVLPSSFHGVLIVDEAHAYDAYMGRELERLVASLAVTTNIPQIIGS
jgi:CRISPR-associated endonuclease/helicase Cas3